eukprot:1209300-Pyramimonas_sp.AAC.1
MQTDGRVGGRMDGHVSACLRMSTDICLSFGPSVCLSVSICPAPLPVCSRVYAWSGQLVMYMLAPGSGCGIEGSDASKNGRRRR